MDIGTRYVSYHYPALLCLEGGYFNCFGNWFKTWFASNTRFMERVNMLQRQVAMMINFSFFHNNSKTHHFVIIWKFIIIARVEDLGQVFLSNNGIRKNQQIVLLFSHHNDEQQGNKILLPGSYMILCFVHTPCTPTHHMCQARKPAIQSLRSATILTTDNLIYWFLSDLSDSTKKHCYIRERGDENLMQEKFLLTNY